MDSLLPSEIARLVFGYLQEQSCNNAAQAFLEESPLLYECRLVAAKGRKFSTKVSSIDLIDMLEKYYTMQSIVGDMFIKISNESEKLKHYGDPIDQLKYLISIIESQISNYVEKENCNSPIVSGSKNHLQNVCEHQNNQTINIQQFYNPLSPTRGKKNNCHSTSKSIDDGPCSSSFEENSKIIPNLSKRITKKSPKNMQLDIINNYKGESRNNRNINSSSDEISHIKCGNNNTSREILNYSTAEVQTEQSNSSSFLNNTHNPNDDPIENLSMLTKELLNRKELHERIAQKINKVILPVESSFREDLTSGLSTDHVNASFINEINNAIKSAVEATETDPVFERFLHEVIGSAGETDSSPDDDSETKRDLQLNGNDAVVYNDVLHSSTSDNMFVIKCPIDHKLKNLKQSDIKYNQTSDNKFEKINQEAVNSITSIANETRVNNPLNTIKNNYQAEELKDKSGNYLNELNVSKESKVSSNKIAAMCTKVLSDCNSVEETTLKPEVRNLSTRKEISAISNLNTSVTVIADTNYVTINPSFSTSLSNFNDLGGFSRVTNSFNTLIDEKTTPVLIPCAKEEIKSLTKDNSRSHCIPIAPKFTDLIPSPRNKMYFKTVQVPSSALEKVNESKNNIKIEVNRKLHGGESVELDARDDSIYSNPFTTTIGGSFNETKELITIYSKDIDAHLEVLPTSLPVIDIEESISLTGTGLSPYLKLNKNGCQESSEKFENRSINNSLPKKDMEVLKNTPKSGVKCQLKNSKSLSTPRRKNRHIRVLDFGTPNKACNMNRRNFKPVARSKSVCTLFRSPIISSNKDHEFLYSNKTKGSKLISEEDSDVERSNAKLTSKNALKENINNIVDLRYSKINDSEIKQKQKSLNLKTVGKECWDSNLRKFCIDSQRQLEELSKKVENDKIKPPKSMLEKKDNPVLDRTDNQSNNKNILEIIGSKTISSSQNYQGKVNNIQNRVKRKNGPEKNEGFQEITKSKDVTDEEIKMVQKHTEPSVKIDQQDIGNINSVSQFPDFLDLETPQKDMSLFFPPTPKFHTPGNSLLPENCKMSENNSFQDILNTPEFPVTPCITFTPKTEDKLEKKSSPYYEPSTEKQEKTAKQDMNTKFKSKLDLKLIKSEPPEITEFEVIKENLKDLEMSVKLEKANDNKKNSQKEYHHKISSDSEDLSETDSNTSSSSNSSCSSSSGTITSQSQTPMKSQIHLAHVNNINNLGKNNSGDKKTEHLYNSTHEHFDAVSLSEEKLMNSPSIQDSSKTEDKTPAKNEVIETVISETPNSSHSNIDPHANLTFKFSTNSRVHNIDSPLKSKLNTTKPRIIKNIQIIPPNDNNFLNKKFNDSSKTSKFIIQNTISLTTNNQDICVLKKNNSQLDLELAEKKHRLVEKFKNDSKVNVHIKKKSTFFKKHSNQMKMEINNERDDTRSRTLEKTEKVKDTRKKSSSPKKLRACEQTEKVMNLRKKISSAEKFRTETLMKNKKLEKNGMNSENTGVPISINPEDDSFESIRDDKVGDLMNILKTKVDNVKRDLFSDDENIDFPKNSHKGTAFNQQKIVAVHEILKEPCKESVLECLKLIPTVKPKSYIKHTFQSNHKEYHFIFSESGFCQKTAQKPTRIEPEIYYFMEEFSLPLQLRVEPLNILYKENPEFYSKNKGAFIISNSTKKNNQGKCKDPIPRQKIASQINDINVNRTYFKKSPKLRKRLASPSRKTTHQMEKRTKLDPKKLLNEVDLDEFLTHVVHKS